jgi:hypothetical protein
MCSFGNFIFYKVTTFLRIGYAKDAKRSASTPKIEEDSKKFFLLEHCWHFLTQSPSKEVLSPSLVTAPKMLVDTSNAT